MNSGIQIFDRTAVRQHRDRAAQKLPQVVDLLRELAGRLIERLEDTTRRFSSGLDIGGRGAVAPLLRARGIDVIACDLSRTMAALSGGLIVVADEEWLPFAPASFDLVVASLSLHWVNDLPGTLIQIRRALRPGGLFLASMPCLGTLGELRKALTEAESGLTGGAGPRVSPFPDLSDCAALLQRAGFAMPVADVEEIRLRYADPMALVRELRAAGEANALRMRPRPTPPRYLFPAALSQMTEDDGRVGVTLNLAVLTGWSPEAA